MRVVVSEVRSVSFSIALGESGSCILSLIFH